MPRVRIILEDDEGNVQEMEGQGLLFALADFGEADEGGKQEVSMSVGAHGVWPPEIMMQAHSALNQVVKSATVKRTLDSLKGLSEMLAGGLGEAMERAKSGVEEA